jgi:hypothetical protein
MDEWRDPRGDPPSSSSTLTPARSSQSGRIIQLVQKNRCSAEPYQQIFAGTRTANKVDRQNSLP